MELNSLKTLGVSQVLITGSLFFDLDYVQKYNIPIRVVANQCVESYIPTKDGIKGHYIRPEDISIYEEYISTIEFYYNTLKQESALFKIYALEKQWNGNLNLLLSGLNYNIDNRIIPEDFAAGRLNCGQRCMRSGSCHLCDTIFKYTTYVDVHQDELRKRLEEI